MKKLLYLLFLVPCSSWAVPVVTNITGTLSNGSEVIVSGSGFGTKTHQKTMVWADFEEGTNTTPYSNYSTSTTWTATNNIAYTPTGCFTGGGCLTSSPGWASGTHSDSPNFGVELAKAKTGYGRSIYWQCARKESYTIVYSSENWKWARIWARNILLSGPGRYPDHYFATDVGNHSFPVNFHSYVELLTNPGGYYNYNQYWGGAKQSLPHATWQLEDWEWHFNSALGLKDGSTKLTIDNVVQYSTGAWQSDEAAYPGQSDAYYALHDEGSNFGPGHTVNGSVWLDNVYMDDYRSRIMIGNASTLAACTRLQVLPYRAWADGSVTALVVLDDISGNAWMYAYDDNGNASSALALVTGTTYPTGGSGGGGSVITGKGIPIAVKTR